jgi:hypothetical protein
MTRSGFALEMLNLFAKTEIQLLPPSVTSHNNALNILATLAIFSSRSRVINTEKERLA